MHHKAQSKAWAAGKYFTTLRSLKLTLSKTGDTTTVRSALICVSRGSALRVGGKEELSFITAIHFLHLPLRSETVFFQFLHLSSSHAHDACARFVINLVPIDFFFVFTLHFLKIYQFLKTLPIWPGHHRLLILVHLLAEKNMLWNPLVRIDQDWTSPWRWKELAISLNIQKQYKFRGDHLDDTHLVIHHSLLG